MGAGLRLAALALLPSLACATGAPRGDRHQDAVATKWHYQISLDRALTRLDARVCFEGPTPRELRPGKHEGTERLDGARWLGPGTVHKLPIVRGRIQLDAQPNGCVGYGIKLREGGSLGSAVRRVGRDLLASPNVWLWRPERRASDAQATLELTLPEGITALLPWPEQDAAAPRVAAQRLRVLDAAAFRFDSYAAFGHFARHTRTHGGVQLELALLDGALAIDGESALRWLGTGVDMLRTVDGAFPTRRLSVIVVPAGAQPEPVPFGMMARGGEASLLLLVSASADEPALLRDWVLPHELAHLLLPFLERDQAWLSEGIATYYQELLRARAGLYTEAHTFARLVRSLREAADDSVGTNVLDESARMHATHAYRRVYWAGAAYWFTADVQLRADTQGHASLDSVLATLRRREDLDRMWTASELVRELDALAGRPLFSELYEAAGKAPFPAFEPTLAALGVRGAHDALELDDAAPLAEVRRALLRAPR